MKRNEQISAGRALTGVLIAAGAGLLALLLLVIGGARFSWDLRIAGPIVIGVYAIGIAVWQIVADRVSRKAGADSASLNPVLGNIMLDMVQKMDDPVIICDEATEGIIWFNRAASLLLQDKRKSLHGTSVASFAGISAAEIMDTEASRSKELPIAERSFRAKGYRIHSAERTFDLLQFREVTELEDMKRTADMQNMAVGYIMIDNVDEMLQYEQERYRSTVSKIDGILRDWAAETHGILKEYERDRYLLLMTRENLNACAERKFDVLDTIRDIHYGETIQPVTISVGFADVAGTYADKEKAAQQSLDMALQRGGDQVVLKGDGSLDFYGGRTKAIQKRTRVRSRVVATELVSLISRSSGVMIMAHRYPDFDAIASAVGLARICLFCGVPVNIVMERRDPNLQGCFAMLDNEPEYDDMFIDAPTAMDRIRTDTLLIITDVNNPALYESKDLAEACSHVVVIDHHRKASEFSREPLLSYIEPSASAASELVAEMMEQILPNESVLPAEASLLMAGILLDTKQFSRNTGTRTYSAALYLRDHGVDTVAVQDLFRTNLDDFRREAKFHSNVVIYRGVTAIALGDGEGDAADRIAAAKAADKLLTVEGVEASFAMIKIGDRVHISARSTGKINVQLIMEKCGGGGHYDGAATQITTESVTDALISLKSAIDAYLDGLAASV